MKNLIRRFFDSLLVVISIIHLGYAIFNIFYFDNLYDSINYFLIGVVYIIIRKLLGYNEYVASWLSLVLIIIFISIHSILHFVYNLTTFREFILYYHIGFITTILIFILAIKFEWNNKKLLIQYFIILIFSVLIGNFGYRVFYKPWHWMDECTRSFILTAQRNVSDKKVKEFSRCRYDKLKSRYGSINNFPIESEYTREDIYDMFECLIEHFVEDSLQIESKNNRENYIDQYLKNKNKIQN